MTADAVRPWRRRVYRGAALALSAVLAAAAVEGVLRLVGASYLVKVYRAAAPVEGATDFLLCVGDSHTAGVGAPEGYAYPDQLETMLNEASEARRWQVVNLGQPGFNSSQAATRAIAFLENDSRPVRAVLFNAGKNNEHNLTAARILPREVRELGLRASVAYLLSNSRAFRFGQITLSRLDALQEKTDGELASLGYGLVINEKGEAERRFLQDWLDRDLTALSAAASPRGARLVLVNYYGRVDWLEEEFERFAARHDAIAADVWRFGIEGPGGGLVARKFLSPDKHPNEQGYARVASLVRDVLVREKIIP